ncbi:MAG: hypothetical protein ACI8U3_002152 [Brevundimonas sp.]|jgi:hypothetical protein|uniref:SIR2 family protein n=1 Tax=Brevundimonas sp. TaxID=1871086 RepID=UPI0039E61FF7
MRFSADTPNLPDDLLLSRDLGDVVFFCGAGVSRSRANLPDFRDLANRVINDLGSATDSAARANAAQPTGMAVDRVFRLLEREFEAGEVREAVARHLDAGATPDLAAHRILLDLSTSRSGVTRLVTTNFDTLFEQSRAGLAWSAPPRLPDPHNDLDFRGVVHIHGRIGQDRGAPPELVLSSADFGRAYMSDGWATRFIRRLLERFQVVFVGYSAEDAPVQYLLEALDLPAGARNKLYTLENADDSEAIALWEHKGVEAIPYGGGFPVLWETLELWAERARDPDVWLDRVLATAADGPCRLTPHQRGQVAHILGSAEGVRRMVGRGAPLPASWLNVLDPSGRYETPETRHAAPEAEVFDPFEAFGLDSDAPPPPADPTNFLKRREVPAGAWNGFVSSRADRRDPLTQTLVGLGSDSAPPLPARLGILGAWIRNIAHQPEVLLWAVRRGRLHPDVLQRIDWALRGEAARFDPIVRDGWRWFLMSLADQRKEADRVNHELRARAAAEGWSRPLVRAWCAMFRPKLTVAPARSLSAESIQTVKALGDLISLSVSFPRPHQVVPPDDAFMGYAVECFRENLNLAVALQSDVCSRSSLYLTPTRGPGGDLVGGDAYGVTGVLATFQRMFIRLAELDPSRARSEMATWPLDDERLFARLRIWALGLPNLVSGEDTAAAFLALSERVFWDTTHQRDLLFALRDRWPDFPPAERRALETRLLTGTYPYADERYDRAAEFAAYDQLNRIHWLAEAGVDFGFDLAAETAQRRAINTDWTPEIAADAVDANTGEVFSIERDTNPASLVGIPMNAILAASQQASGLRIRDRVHRDPFAGLSDTAPLRALGALTLAGRAQGAPAWAWADFLRSDARARDGDRLLRTIALRLTRLPVGQLSGIAYPASEWMQAHAARLHSLPEIADRLWTSLVETQRLEPGDSDPCRLNRAWAEDALNGPVGRLFHFLMADPAGSIVGVGDGLPSDMKRRLEELLALPGDLRGQAVVMAAFQLTWLFEIDPDWTTRELLPLMDRPRPEAEPFWQGFLWRAHEPRPDLFARMKTALIGEAAVRATTRRHGTILGDILLLAWARGLPPDNTDSHLTSAELREILIHADDDLRRGMLWTLGRWAADGDGPWADRVVLFLRDVWPRQRALRTPAMSDRLADLVLAVPSRFPELVQLVLPRLVPVRSYGSPLDGLDDPLIERHPVEVLDLVWALLGEDSQDWPYGIFDTLDRLAEQPSVQDDTRLSELRSRLQS